MKIQTLLLLAILGIVTLMAACKKEDEAPKIFLEEPTEGSLVSGEVHLHGKVTDESLHNLKIKVTKDADGTELFSFSKHWHGRKEYEIDEHFTPEGIAGETPVTLFIEVEDDLDQVATKTVKFRVKP